jgi:putative ABC transport system ATP-binding protein
MDGSATDAASSPPAVEFRNVRKIYAQGRHRVTALDGVSLSIRRGELVAVMGPSGSGKSTLLNMAGCLDLPTEGEVLIRGESTLRLSDTALTLLRRRAIGFVFQFFNLIPTLTAEENVGLPALLNGEERPGVRERAGGLLRRMGLEERLDHYPDELSGGEMQRVAIARAIITNPAILLADEPTGNLDTAAGHEVLAILGELSKDRAVVVVTHDEKVAACGTRVLRLRDGRLA